jgi:hypothetical protein
VVSQQHALFGIVAWLGMLVAWLVERVKIQASVPAQTELVIKHNHSQQADVAHTFACS